MLLKPSFSLLNLIVVCIKWNCSGPNSWLLQLHRPPLYPGSEVCLTATCFDAVSLNATEALHPHPDSRTFNSPPFGNFCSPRAETRLFIGTESSLTAFGSSASQDKNGKIMPNSLCNNTIQDTQYGYFLKELEVSTHC